MKTRQLTYAFFGEGATEYRFLRSIVQRELARTMTHVDFLWDEQEVHLSASQLPDHVSKLKFVLERSEGRSFVIFHADADSQGYIGTLDSRFKRPLQIVLEDSPKLRREIMPIIPVRSTEAWMLVDVDALKTSLGLAKIPSTIKIPSRVDVLEGRNSEMLMARLLTEASKERRRSFRYDVFCEEMSRRVHLNLLERLPSFREFRNLLRNALENLPHLKA